MPNLSATPEKNLPNGRGVIDNGLRFIFWPHDERYLPRIMPHLANCDVIAYENFTDRETAKSLEEGFNALSQSQSLKPKVAELLLGNIGYYAYELAKLTQGSGKVFVSMDAYVEGGMKDLFTEFESSSKRFLRCLAGYGAPSDAQALYRGYAQSLAGLTNNRDKAMAQNIDKMAGQYPDSKIAVVVGAGHTNIARLVTVNTPIEKTYVNFHPYSRARLEYGADFTAARYYQFGLKPPALVVRKAILQHLIIHTLSKGEYEAAVYGINYLSETEVNKYIDQLERASVRAAKDPKAEFRYRNAITQASKQAVKALVHF